MFSGMGKEVENLIMENNELLATKWVTLWISLWQFDKSITVSVKLSLSLVCNVLSWLTGRSNWHCLVIFLSLHVNAKQYLGYDCLHPNPYYSQFMFIFATHMAIYILSCWNSVINPLMPWDF
jgi:hypothetical protein